MTISRPLIPILAAVLLGSIAHAGEFSLGSARLLAENGVQANVDVTVNFIDRGHTMHETAEGGDATPRNARPLRGADDVAAQEAPAHRASTATPAPKPAEPAPVATDSPHGVSISPSTAIRRPSYRWQSLVPGTIK